METPCSVFQTGLGCRKNPSQRGTQSTGPLQPFAKEPDPLGYPRQPGRAGKSRQAGARECELSFEITEKEHPDLVILDLQMPDQSGTDFYRKLTKHKDLHTTPIIVVSGLAGRHLAVRQPVAVFDKPIDPEEFGATVDRALGINNGDEE